MHFFIHTTVYCSLFAWSKKLQEPQKFYTEIFLQEEEGLVSKGFHDVYFHSDNSIEVFGKQLNHSLDSQKSIFPEIENKNDYCVFLN